MRITIVNGFFLPVPPLSGGSTEKSWYFLGREFAARGHQVLSISRTWQGLPDEETVDGVTYRRLPGYDHRSRLTQNLVRDLWWSWRVFRSLPPADVVICNAVLLPTWLGRFKPSAGRVVVMSGRMPKGQYRRYNHLARILAPSSLVRDRIQQENPALADLIRITGYPIDHATLRQPQAPSTAVPPRRDPEEVTLGFVGRIHEEKGLMLLADALAILAAKPDLPPWRVLLCGPTDISRGGSGGDFRRQLLARLGQTAQGNRVHLLDPEFNDRTLAAVYQRLDVFCYPSLAEAGETFGVAVAEAMAAGAVPVVSDLTCFRDFVRDGENGVRFDHRAPDAAAQLAGALERLLRDPATRQRLAARGRDDVLRYDYPHFASALLEDFTQLLAR